LAVSLVAVAVGVNAAELKRPTSLEIELDIVVQVVNPETKQVASKTENHRIWIRGSRVRREERTIDGTEIRVEAEGTLYLFAPDPKRGLKQKIDKPVMRPEYPEYFDGDGFRGWITKNGGKRAGSERIGTTECDLYTQSTSQQEMHASLKRWVRKDNAIPVKIVETVEGESSGPKRISTFTVKKAKVGEAIDESLFKVPKDYEFQDVKDLEAKAKAAAKSQLSTGKSKKKKR